MFRAPLQFDRFSPVGQNPARYVAVGASVGVLGDAQGRPVGSQGQPAWWIRVGGDFYALDLRGMRVWLKAQTPVSSSQLAEAVEGLGGDWDQALDALIQEQLIVQLPESGDEPSATVRRLRGISHGIGLGQSAEDPARFEIGTPDGTVAVTCDFASYILWTFLDGWHSLQQAVDATVQHLQCEAADIWTRVPDLLSAWLETRVLTLDRMPTQAKGLHGAGFR